MKRPDTHPRSVAAPAPGAFTLLVALVACLFLAGAAGAATITPQDAATPPASALRLPSGVVVQVLVPGTGSEHPDANDVVVAHYTGWDRQGKKFAATRDQAKGEPRSLPMSEVSAGMRDAFARMVIGETLRVWIPEGLGPKDGQGGPKSAVFDLELQAIRAVPDPPASLDKAPADARRSPSGGWYQEVMPGSGTEVGGPEGRVMLNWTLWDDKGRLIDSTAVRGKPTVFLLDRVLPAFSEMVQDMKVGGKRRLWLPPGVHGGEWPRSPKDSMLIFEVELLSILPKDALKVGA